MPSDLESASLAQLPGSFEDKTHWVKVGLVTAVSALAGGLAVGWWYRKTLASLREVEDGASDSQIGISEGNPEGE
jgi:hypothetical protein